MFKINKFIYRLIEAVMIISLLLANVCTVFAEELDDLDIPPYKSADVTRKDVVVWATPTTIPAEFASNVIRTYPDGKTKAFIMSFDDGGQSGYTMSDKNLVLPALRDNGLKAAFNLNQQTGLIPTGINVGYDDPTASSRTAIYSGRMDSQQYKDIMSSLYEGMEISNHTRDHLTASNLSKDNLRIQVGECKNTLENVFGREVAGYASAGGTNTPDPVLPSTAWRMEYMKYVGHRYIRNAPTKWPAVAGSPATLDMNVPTDFYNWNPTIKLTQDDILKNGTAVYSRVDILNYLLNTDFGDQMKLLFMWGHGWEMGGSDKSLPNSNYSGFVSMCQLAGQNLNVLWNPTPIDYVDYINATWNVKFRSTESGDIVIYNPSGAVTVWQKVYGNLISVEPGKIVTVNSNGLVTDTIQGETVTNNKPGGYRNGEEFTDFTTASQNPGTGIITVKGSLTSSYSGLPVSLMMVSKNADVGNLSDSDVKYMSQATIDALGQYSFSFPADGLLFDENRQCSNYTLLLNVTGKDVTQSIDKAIISASLIRTNVSIEMGDTLATAVAKIDNMSNTSGQTYQLMLAFYDANNAMVGIKAADSKTIQNGLIGYRISDVVPEGTAKIKAFLWTDVEFVMPRGESAAVTYNAK